MRAALLILLGLAIGALGATFALNAWRARDPLPRAVMDLLGHHAGQLKQTLKSQRCDADGIRHQLSQMQAVSGDIDAAFAGADATFFHAADELRVAVNGALRAAPADCASLARAVKPIGDACENCHRQYR
jgi:cytochrome c556